MKKKNLQQIIAKIKTVFTTFTLVFLSVAMCKNLTCSVLNPIRHKILLQAKCLVAFFSSTIYKDTTHHLKLFYNHEQIKCIIHVQGVLQYYRV